MEKFTLKGLVAMTIDELKKKHEDIFLNFEILKRKIRNYELVNSLFVSAHIAPILFLSYRLMGIIQETSIGLISEIFLCACFFIGAYFANRRVSNSGIKKIIIFKRLITDKFWEDVFEAGRGIKDECFEQNIKKIFKEIKSERKIKTYRMVDYFDEMISCLLNNETEIDLDNKINKYRDKNQVGLLCDKEDLLVKAVKNDFLLKKI